MAQKIFVHTTIDLSKIKLSMNLQFVMSQVISLILIMGLLK